jgi:hypothetical protein
MSRVLKEADVRLMFMSIKYYGGELPEVSKPFTIVLNHQNWDNRARLLRSVFATINPRFVAYIPEFPTDCIYSLAEREYLSKLHQLLESHGLGHVSVQIDPCVRELFLPK